MLELRRRCFRTELKVRAAGAGEKRLIEGHAAVYNQESEVLGGWFVEVIVPGAFTDSLQARDDVRCLFNHDDNLILGRTKARTLRLRDEAVGLAYECDPPDTQAARDVLISIERGDVDQSSFAFETVLDRWTFSRDPKVPAKRELLKAKLFDVSPVTYPAYPTTDVKVRSRMADENKAILEEAIRRHSLAGDGFDTLRLAALRLAEAEGQV